MENKWSSNLAFILASTGAAIGLGNLWKFPYLMGENGGFWFLLFYAFFTVVLGLPIMLSELSVGKYTQKENISAYISLGKGGGIIGFIGAICSFIVLCYYGVVGGWIIKYVLHYTMVGKKQLNFDIYIQDSLMPVIFQLIFIAITALLCVNGTKSIEKSAKIMMPSLAVILIALAVRNAFLPNSKQGYEFMLSPVKSVKLSALTAALGQVFYSMSLCMGVNVTYGSYLNKKENIFKNSVIIAFADALIAIVAGLAIFPAVFSYGLEPTAGTGLTFKTLPIVFDNMPLGRILGAAFFVLMLFAALTSSVSLVESVGAGLINRFNISRVRALFIVALTAGTVGSLCSLSFGLLSKITIMGYTLFEFMNIAADNVLMPFNGLLLCIYMGWIWNTEFVKKHLNSRLFVIWRNCIKYITPVFVLIIFVNSIINLI